VSGDAGFVPFSATHGVVVIASAALVIGFVWLGRRWRGSPRQRRLELAVGWLGLAQYLAYLVWFGRAEGWDLKTVLPLQMCDVTAMAAVWVLVGGVGEGVGRRRAQTLVYFWGVVFSSQGFVTPTVRWGLESPGFWFFWATHLLILAAACYAVAVRRYRPTVGDCALAVAVSFVYLAVALSANAMLGSNYGYVGRGLPGAATIVDALGPWPLRVVWIALLGLAGMGLALLPWLVFKPRAPSSGALR